MSGCRTSLRMKDSRKNKNKPLVIRNMTMFGGHIKLDIGENIKIGNLEFCENCCLRLPYDDLYSIKSIHIDGPFSIQLRLHKPCLEDIGDFNARQKAEKKLLANAVHFLLTNVTKNPGIICLAFTNPIEDYPQAVVNHRLVTIESDSKIVTHYSHPKYADEP